MQGAGQEESKDERHKRLTRQSVLAADTGCRPLRRSHAPCSSAMEIDSGFRRPVTSRGAAAPPPSPFRYKWAAAGDAQPPSPPTSFLISTAQTRRAAQTPFSTLHHPISQPQKARCWGLHGRLCRRQTSTALAKTEGRRPHRHRYRPSYLPVPTTVGGGGSGSGLPAAESGSSRPSVAAIASVATASALPPPLPPTSINTQSPMRAATRFSSVTVATAVVTGGWATAAEASVAVQPVSRAAGDAVHYRRHPHAPSPSPPSLVAFVGNRAIVLPAAAAATVTAAATDHHRSAGRAVMAA